MYRRSPLVEDDSELTCAIRPRRRVSCRSVSMVMVGRDRAGTISESFESFQSRRGAWVPFKASTASVLRAKLGARADVTGSRVRDCGIYCVVG